MEKLILFSLVTSLLAIISTGKHLPDTSMNRFTNREVDQLIQDLENEYTPTFRPQEISKQSSNNEATPANIVAPKMSESRATLDAMKSTGEERKESSLEAKSNIFQRIFANEKPPSLYDSVFKLADKSLGNATIASTFGVNRKFKSKYFDRKMRNWSHPMRYGRYFDALASSIF